jgi:endonuclease-8
MPEGDTIFRAARMLHGALAGQPVTRFQSVFPKLTRVDEDHPLAGRLVESVAARGKHLLMTFSGDLVLHTHLRMNGVWHVYRPGDRWRRAARDMRIVISTADADAVGFNIPVAQFLTARQLARHDRLRQLGPDLLDPAFDAQAVIERAAAHGEAAIADLLLDQRVISGLGNVLKSETLFVARIHPFARVRDLSIVALEHVIEVARRLMRMNVREPTGIAARGSGRRTVNALDPRVRLWVYGRAGKPCRNCGAAIATLKTGLDARITYWCPHCQPVQQPKEDE